MKYQILKQYIQGNDNIWVGAINEQDTIEIFNTLEEALIKLEELTSLNPDRGFKIVETQ